MATQVIKHMLTSKVALITILLTFFGVATDISKRLNSNKIENNNHLQKNDIKVLKLPTVSAQLLNDIEQRYKKYQIESTDTLNTKTVGMSAEQQALQAGELETVYIGEHKIELKAVISSVSASQSVLLQVNNSANGHSGIEKYSNYADVYGFQLTVLSNTQVQLVKNALEEGADENENKTPINMNNSKQQKIILTMYKPRT